MNSAEPAYVNGFVDGCELVLLYRDGTGELKARRKPAEWSSFHRRDEMTDEVMRDLRSTQFVAGVSVEGEWVRVRWRGDEVRRRICAADGYFAQNAIRCYEADVDPVVRYFADTGARVAKPRRAYIDIETDPRVPPAQARKGKARVLSWVVTLEEFDDQGEPIVHAVGVLGEDADDAEKALLEALWRALDKFDQVVAWFGDGFDFPVTRMRSDITGVKSKDLRRWLFIDLLEVYERNIPHLESGDEKDSLKLGDVCQAAIGRTKKKFDVSKGWEYWEAGGALRQQLVDYMIEDGKLLPLLERAKGFLALNDSVCEVARVFGDTSSTQPITFVDAFMLRLAVEKGQHFGTRVPLTAEERENREKFAGAFVMDPKYKGIQRSVHVCDFSGMYPSIILSWNMSPETKRDVPINGPIPEGHCRSPVTRKGFLNEPTGLLCEALIQFGELRKYWSKLQASLPPGSPEWLDAGRKSQTYKVLRNCFYGVIGSLLSRYFDVEIATSTTQTGVWLIQATIAEAQRRSIEPIYGDTDSAMVRGVTRQQFGEFVAWCNRELYPPMAKSTGAARNYLEVAYEKEFDRIVFVSKKAYAATFRHYKWQTNCVEGCDGALSLKTMRCDKCGRVFTDDTLPVPRGRPEIKGLDFRRGDRTRLARHLQERLIEHMMIARSDDPASYEPMIEAARTHVLEEPLQVEEISVGQSLTKPLKQYVQKVKKDGSLASDSPHVRVARLLANRGEQIGEGTKISYFYADGEAKPAKVVPVEDYAGECDRFYVWEHQVYPAAQRLLEAAFPAHDWTKYERVRPGKARRNAAQAELQLSERNPGSGRRGKVAPTEQGSLFVPPQPRAAASSKA